MRLRIRKPYRSTTSCSVWVRRGNGLGEMGQATAANQEAWQGGPLASCCRAWQHGSSLPSPAAAAHLSLRPHLDDRDHDGVALAFSFAVSLPRALAAPPVSLWVAETPLPEPQPQPGRLAAQEVQDPLPVAD